MPAAKRCKEGAMAQFPNDPERKAFVEKLAKFRSTLPASEQRMLDAMAAAVWRPSLLLGAHAALVWRRAAIRRARQCVGGRVAIADVPGRRAQNRFHLVGRQARVFGED